MVLKQLYPFFVLVIFVSISFCSLFLLYDHFDSKANNNRILLEEGGLIPPVKRWYPYVGLKVPDITTPLLPDLVKARLARYFDAPADDSNKKITIDQDEASKIEINDTKKLNTALHKWQSDIISHINTPSEDELDLLLHGLNHDQASILYHSNKTTATNRKKTLEDRHFSEFVRFDPRYYRDVFDIVIVTSFAANDLNYLEQWKEAILGVHCIVIQQGDSSRVLSIPSWLEYELYTQKDINNAMGKEVQNGNDNDYLFDISSHDDKYSRWVGLSFGLLVSDRDFVYFIDELSPYPAKQASNLLQKHAIALSYPSSNSYFNGLKDLFVDKSAGDFVKGMPYSLRAGYQSAISIGICSHEVDSLTEIAHSIRHQSNNHHYHSSTQHKPVASDSKRRLRGTGAAVADGTQDTGATTTTTIAKGMLLSIPLHNIAIRRDAIGPAFLQFGNIARETSYNIGDNIHLVNAWIAKTVADHLGLGVKVFNAERDFINRDKHEGLTTNVNHIEHKEDISPHSRHSKKHHASDSSSSAKESHYATAFDPGRLTEDLNWLEHSETVIRFFSEVTLSDKARESITAAMYEILPKISSKLGSLHPFYAKLGAVSDKYIDYWTRRNAFITYILPVSSRSSYRPQNDSQHKCAVFTIARNDKEMLSIWSRYYSRHLPRDMFILVHQSDEERTILPPSITRNFPHVIDINGDATGFPFYLFVHYADLYQRRFFRYGYKCVLLTDADEIIIVDPDKYPKGLSEYLTKFVQDKDRHIHRAHGMFLAHVSESDNFKPVLSERIEPPLDWEKPIFAQRHFWMEEKHYNKPILSKIAVRYKPGFHNLHIPKPTFPDYDMKLLHLRDMDKDFCLKREKNKAALAAKARQSEIKFGLNDHLIHYDSRLKNGMICQYALSVYMRNLNRTRDNTGKVDLWQIENKWRSIDI